MRQCIKQASTSVKSRMCVGKKKMHKTLCVLTTFGLLRAEWVKPESRLNAHFTERAETRTIYKT